MADWQRHFDATLERNRIAQAELQQYASAAVQRNEIAQAEFRSYADEEIARNDRAQAEFRRSLERATNAPTVPQLSSQPFATPGRGFVCDPVTLRRGGPIYTSSYVPTMAVCPSCYATHVKHTPLASHFTLEELQMETEHTCDMSATAIRAAWLRYCVRISHGNVGDAERVACIIHFAQAFKMISDRIQHLTPEITRLKQEIQEAKAHLLHQELGSTPLLPALTPMGMFSAGSIAHHAAMSRYVAGSDVNETVAQKQTETVRLRTELRGLLGVPDTY
ncbi:hypothetical protein LTR78_003157 [Recurvomyces mirabilis]|uniref:Uncharacterized protein n=1 Tax=Recurvomyces mirabilis TaxID=574656 RepID=A0AAE1C3M3_9PEZI|nr:hypothetical protein LTR78_003157 [Recurvomyces mirabilis]KAK5157023.1 hypothetical protein LTS14_004540 [Recurvomyces mirabilis]